MRSAVAGKARVHELAKELGVDSKTVLGTLKEMGEFVKSASSTVEAPVVRKLKERLGATPEPSKGGGARPTPSPAANGRAGGGAGPRPSVPSPGAGRPMPGPGPRPGSGPRPGGMPGPSGPRPAVEPG